MREPVGPDMDRAPTRAMRWGPQLLEDGRTRFVLWAPDTAEPPALELAAGPRWR